MRRLDVRWAAAILAAAAIGATAIGSARAGDAPDAAQKPLALHNLKDPVTGQPASGKFTLAWEGLEIRFACDDSAEKFKADPAGFSLELLRDLTAQRDAMHEQLATARGLLEKAGVHLPAGDAHGEPCDGRCDGGMCGGDCGDCDGKDCPCKGGRGTCPGGCPEKAGAAPSAPAVPAAPAPAAKPAPAPEAKAPAALPVVDVANSHCPVMPEHEALAESTVTWRNLKVRLCCPACTKKFLADPEGYLKALSADPAVAQRIATARAAWDAANPPAPAAAK